MPSPVTISRSEVHTLESLSNQESYPIWVQVPVGYADSDKQYPVLYVTDAQWNFPVVTALRTMISHDPKLRDLIIVGIAFTGPWPKVVSQRAYDLTPLEGVDIEGQKTGGAEMFLSFIESQVVPFIDHTYRTESGDRGLFGHSYGGVFGLFALLNRPNLFQKIATLDPTITVSKGTFLAKLKETAAKIEWNNRLYLALGTQEPDISFTENTILLRALRSLRPNGLAYRADYFEDTHTSIVTRATVDALRWLYHPELQVAPLGEYPPENDF